MQEWDELALPSSVSCTSALGWDEVCEWGESALLSLVLYTWALGWDEVQEWGGLVSCTLAPE